MRRLIWGFAGRTYDIVGNLMHWLIIIISAWANFECVGKEGSSEARILRYIPDPYIAFVSYNAYVLMVQIGFYSIHRVNNVELIWSHD